MESVALAADGCSDAVHTQLPALALQAALKVEDKLAQKSVAAPQPIAAPVPVPAPSPTSAAVAAAAASAQAAAASAQAATSQHAQSAWSWLGFGKKVRSDSADSDASSGGKHSRRGSALSSEEHAKKQAAKDAAAAAAAAAKDHLGGVEHPWLHSVVRFSVDKLLGLEEVEEGMEPQWRHVLCRESLWVPAEVDGGGTSAAKASAADPSAVDPDAEPPLLLEMSHFYPRGFHATPLPVILVRTPYDRALMRHTAERLCRHGYHVLIQDTRNSPNAAALKAKQNLKRRALKKAQAVAAICAPVAAKQEQPAGELEQLQQAYNMQLEAPPAKTQISDVAFPSSSSDSDHSPSNSPPASASSSNAANAASAALPAAAAASAASAPHPVLSPAPQEFFPIAHESKDGLATLDWIVAQPWCDGGVSMFGLSYLGIAQYAVVNHRHPALKCIAPVISASRVYPILYPGGSFNLDLAARWLHVMFHRAVVGPDAPAPAVGADGSVLSEADDPKLPSFWSRSFARVVGQRSIVPKALDHLPACELDQLVTERPLSFFQEMISHGHDPNLPFWREKQTTLCDLALAPPIIIIEGWFDLFLREALRDYVDALAIWKQFQKEKSEGLHSEAETAAMGPSLKKFKPYLTILNCVHIDWKQLYAVSLRESILWFDVHLKGKIDRLKDRDENKSVRIQMIHASGSNETKHRARVAKRKKAEAKAAAAAAAAATKALGAPTSSSAAAAPDPSLLARQELLDAEWLSFPEFPPPGIVETPFYLYCELDPRGEESRVLRREAPGEREKMYAEEMEALAVRAQRKAEEKAAAAAEEARLEAEMQKVSVAADATTPVAQPAVSIAAPPAASPSSTSSSSSSASASSFVSAISAAAAAAHALSVTTLEKAIYLSSGVGASSASASVPPPSSSPTPLSPPLPPARSHYSLYSYDPRHPTPAVGGATFDVENSGALDQRSVEAREDILVFTSPPLTEPLLVLGFVRCTLFVRSSAPATDFVARLCDVYPLDESSPSADVKAGSGKSQVLCDGLVKVSPSNVDQLAVEKPAARRSQSQQQGNNSLAAPPSVAPMGSDTATPLLKLDIDMWATGNVFQVGHRIRLHVCSAAHPRWLRSLGGPDPMFCGLDQAVVQHQTVYHDSKYPSALVLPVLPLP